MQTLRRNFLLTFRQLVKSPGFTLTVVITLALGIGATTAIFSVIEGVLLRPLPFKDSSRLAILGDHLGSGAGISVTAHEIESYSQSTAAFSSMGGYIPQSYELSGGATPEEVSGVRFTADVFRTLAVDPLLGRFFTRQEDVGHQLVAVISYGLWLERFQRDRNVLGSSITLDRKTYTVIGVMPREFKFPLGSGPSDQPQLWVPMSFTPDELSEESGFWGYHIIARMKDGVTFTQAAQDADRVAKQIMHGFPVTKSALRISGDVTPLHEYVVGEVRKPLRMLLLAVLVVLLIACANVAGLLLVRAIRRRREYAVRLALGARPSAVIRESVLEGLILSLMGGALGLALATVAIRTTLHLLPDSMPRIESVSMDLGVVCFALTIAIVTGTLCSLAPAFAALRTNITETLKQGDRGGAGSESHAWLRSTLVVTEIAVSLVLLSVSGAFLRSLQKMHAVDPGFRADHVLVAGYELPLNQYSTQSSLDSFDREVVERLSHKPGVISVGISDVLPASGEYTGAAYTIEDEPVEQWKLKFAQFAITYGDYFQALQVPLFAGRYFNEHDRTGAPPVIIVNQTMAKDRWPRQNAVGKRMHVGNPKKGLPWATVVGVVADTKTGSRDEPTDDQWYAPMQQPEILGLAPGGNLARADAGYIVLRSALAPEQMTQVLRSTVAEVDPLLPLQQIQPMRDVISNIEAPRSFNTQLITAFAIGALLLAVTGIYAVIAFSVSLRTQEIAVRMALGAQRSGIARLVLISAAKLTLLGCAIGVIGSLAVSRAVSSFLFEVSPTDPIIYSVSVLLMMLLAFVASALPARRAASADPITALRTT